MATVHTNDMKLRILNWKISADILQATKPSINLELAEVLVTTKYKDPLSTFRDQVNQKFPPNFHQVITAVQGR